MGSPGIDGNGGGFNSLGNDPVLLDNSIIAANSAAGVAPDLRTGSVTLDIEYSLLGNDDGLQITNSTANQIGTASSPLDPRLGPLAHNGGPTQTHALLPSSPAIDAGDPNILPAPDAFDQRGAPFLRVEDGDSLLVPSPM